MMSVLLTVLAAVLGLVGAIVALLILVPSQVWAAGDVSFERLWGDARVRWGFGLLTLRFSSELGAVAEVRLLGVRLGRFDLVGKEDDEEEKAKKKKKKKKKKRATEKGGDGARKWIGWVRDHRRTLVRIVGRLLLTFDPRLRVTGVVGLGDPADTALLFEILRRLEAIRPERVELALEREWLEEELDVQIRFVALIWPAHMLFVAVALLFEPGTWRMLRAARA